MAFSSREIAEAYVQDMTKYIPMRRVRGAAQNTRKVGGRITPETERILRERTDGQR